MSNNSVISINSKKAFLLEEIVQLIENIEFNCESVNIESLKNTIFRAVKLKNKTYVIYNIFEFLLLKKMNIKHILVVYEKCSQNIIEASLFDLIKANLNFNLLSDNDSFVRVLKNIYQNKELYKLLCKILNDGYPTFKQIFDKLQLTYKTYTNYENKIHEQRLYLSCYKKFYTCELRRSKEHKYCYIKELNKKFTIKNDYFIFNNTYYKVFNDVIFYNDDLIESDDTSLFIQIKENKKVLYIIFNKKVKFYPITNNEVIEAKFKAIINFEKKIIEFTKTKRNGRYELKETNYFITEVNNENL